MLTKKTMLANTVNRLIYAFGTEKMRKQMDDYERNEMKNWLTRVYDRKEGRAEGGMEKAVEIAKKMLAKGRDKNEIAEATSLTVDDILRL